MAATTIPTDSPCGWRAAGYRGGITYGATDELGLSAVEDKLHVHDIHATILYCLGLEHTELTVSHNGRDERPTVNGGRRIGKILA